MSRDATIALAVVAGVAGFAAGFVLWHGAYQLARPRIGEVAARLIVQRGPESLPAEVRGVAQPVLLLVAGAVKTALDTELPK